ncbi:PAN domain-containing protein [Rhodoplanes serenus]|uniref:PAN domain-containing protein n=1 Tax=Rhodoplanes serenus TaxID=200615 RepID=UPI000DACADA9|nr:PAN domain-containing protein [Rhodoplanes serenus]RAI32463.1 hypothetical protein CH340_15410 [Rhodoplanes serenus]
MTRARVSIRAGLFLLALPLLALLAASGGPAIAQIGFDRPGSDFATFPVRSADPAICASRCERDSRCRAWSFSYPTAEQGAVCRMKAQVTARVADTCCVSGVKGAGVIVPRDGRAEIGIDRAGGDFHGIDLAADAAWPVCKAACEGESRCRAWTFLRAGYAGSVPRCYLKERIPAPRRRPCCVSGVVR